MHVGVNKHTFERRAIKIMNKEHLLPYEFVCFSRTTLILIQKELSHEVEILKSLSHPNIVDLIEVFDSEKSAALVMEL